MKPTPLFLTICLYTGLLMTAVSAHAEPKWGAVVDGVSGTRQLSPTGDILDSNMDALAPLSISPINIPDAQLTPKDLQNPKKAAIIIQKALYLPLEKDKIAELKQSDISKIRTNQMTVLNQVASHNLTFGITTTQSISDFQKRKDNAAKFIPSAENRREDVQVLNGITLGALAETNKMLGLTSSTALLESIDALSGAASLTGE